MRVHQKAAEACRRTFVQKVVVGVPRVVVGLGAVSVFGWSQLAHAAVSCGDVVGPRDFAVLSEDLSCDMSPALTVEGPATLDLKGFTVTCAQPEGTGIELIGSRAKVRNGTIANCAKGAVVEGDGGHRLTHLTVTSPDAAGNGGIAFQVKSSRNRLVRDTVRKFAGEGFRLGDDDVTADLNVLAYDKVVDSENHGFRVRIGEGNLLWHNRAKRNTGEGFRSQGKDNRFVFNTANGNADEGFRIRDEAAQNNLVMRNHVAGNGLDPCNLAAGDANPGIAVVSEAANNRIIGNDVQGNCVGIAVEAGALHNTIIRNIALGSSLVDMADGNVDCDENQWRRNEFESSIAPPGGRFPECIR